MNNREVIELFRRIICCGIVALFAFSVSFVQPVYAADNEDEQEEEMVEDDRASDEADAGESDDDDELNEAVEDTVDDEDEDNEDEEDDVASAVSPRKGDRIWVEATAYSAYDPGNSHYTAMGTRLRKGVIAVDPSFIPLGTRVYIPGYGEAVAEDVGGAIHGNIIDIAFNSHEEALSFGRQEIEITIIEYP